MIYAFITAKLTSEESSIVRKKVCWRATVKEYLSVRFYNTFSCMSWLSLGA